MQALFAFLAATFMTVDTQSEPDLQDDFRRRAIWTQFALIALAGVKQESDRRAGEEKAAEQLSSADGIGEAYDETTKR
jgi:hypothetical protein